MSEKLRPVQFGYGSRGGAEIVEHLVRNFVRQDRNLVTVAVELNFRNAFNSLHYTNGRYSFDESELITKYVAEKSPVKNLLAVGAAYIICHER